MIAAYPILAQLAFEPPRGFAPLAALVLAGVLVVARMYTVGLRGRQHGLTMRLTLLALRVGAIACLVAALMRPVWISETSLEHQPIVAVVLDDSRSMSLPASEDSPVTRYALATQVLQSRLKPALNKSHQIRLFDVQGRLLDDANIPTLPVGASSPLGETLHRVQRGLSDQPLTAIVLLSDGRDRRDETSRLVARGIPLTGTRVPIYPVNLAGTGGAATDMGAADLAIDGVTTNQRAIVGNTVETRVDINLTGQVRESGSMIQIFDGDHIVASQQAQWRPGEPSVRTNLSFVPQRAGTLTYRVQAAALNGETHLSNNRAIFTLDVRAEPLTVLYIDGVLRWEGKFVREALAADPDVNLVTSIRTTAPGEDRGSQGLLAAEHLANIDVVILGDVEATFFSGSELEALRSWVIDGGGGLLMTGGYQSFGPEGLGRTALGAILPVEFSADANPQVERPFGLKLTPLGQNSPIFHITGDRVRDTAFYQSLPSLAGCSRIAGVKPGASVLAVNPNEPGPGEGEGLPVLITQPVGGGRAMVFAVDTTWRWRMTVGGFTGDASFYQTFWSQLVRSLAGIEKDEGESQLTITTDRSRYMIGQSVEIKALLSSRTGEIDMTQWRLTAQAIDDHGERTPVTLERSADAQMHGSLAATVPGRLDLFVQAEPLTVADTEQKQPRAMSQMVTVQVERPDLEMLDPRPDPQWLATVAQSSGGEVLEPLQIDAWARQLSATKQVSSLVQTASLWRHPALATMFFVLLCLEWILRRRSGRA